MANMFVIGVFADQADADNVAKDLKDHDIKSKNIDVVTRESAAAGGGAGAATAPDLMPYLNRLGVPDSDARVFVDSVRRGNALVIAGVKDHKQSRQAITVMLERRGGGPLLERERTGEVAAEPVAGEPVIDRPVVEGEAEHVIPVVEEELRVGKRKVDRSQVHIYTRVVEQPVESEISLRDERVTIQRRPVDRPATEEDLRKAGSIDITESAEEPVIAKEPHVVEEVVVGHEAGEHTEKVHDTVKKTEVEIEGKDKEKLREKP